ncbi:MULTISPECIES: sigma-70 family RNA polymerase sigma factor [Anoxybacillus]|jgi:DNA-directed RNA polymerase|uniref:RNA polymerase sigma factor n=2 Tax=Anoxybacillus TaxID=150247 RepID=A0A178T5K1_9BACL|nr:MULTISPECIES: sigma-70 family RNA polymerase sigma factor [Anoxybacillus]ASA96412.1 RNA polymerase subunit sigma-70 [Anoxybacillus flavithermus]ELK21509.1 RNA polymerase sigma factor, sigma-70 family [Anoxybacillus flavithermus TNO-09.006]MBE2904844.1 sigma-70 family RNA polymerase sigma factor [Anoxybacillus flavithermus]MBE2907560.1 sigma-70 family RNA polymerase sigma factor [Anoxybacillus flavithermus]MBE2909279.1 sigma-70 family RNA polymerase sigma factor [Anoxybacillus flavithermus]
MSFETVVEQYRPLISYIIRKLHIRRHVVDEYMQIGLIALWEAYERYDETKGSFHSFAFKMIRWRIISQLRKETKNVAVPLLDEQMLKEDVDFFTDIIWEDAMRDMTPRERIWLVRHVIEGKTLKQIADEEGVTVHAVKQWRISAVKKLKRYVNCAAHPCSNK